MGSAAGAEKAAARRLGMAVEDYAAKLDAGLKHCRICRRWKRKGLFQRDSSRGSGLAAACTACRNRQGRERHVPPVARKRPGPAMTIGSRRWRQKHG